MNQKRECPCCHAPLPANQPDDRKIVCQYCGAEIILKLDVDARIEQIAFEETAFNVDIFSAIIIVIVAGIIYGWPLWRFWLRDSGWLEYFWIRWGILVLGGCFLWGIIAVLRREDKKARRCWEECGGSLTRLRELVRLQPTSQRKRLLKDIEAKIEELNRKLDL